MSTELSRVAEKRNSLLSRYSNSNCKSYSDITLLAKLQIFSKHLLKKMTISGIITESRILPTKSQSTIFCSIKVFEKHLLNVRSFYTLTENIAARLPVMVLLISPCDPSKHKFKLGGWYKTRNFHSKILSIVDIFNYFNSRVNFGQRPVI